MTTRRGVGYLLGIVGILLGVWVWSLAGPPESGAVDVSVTVAAGRPRQTIVGFGGDFGAWMVTGLSTAERRELFAFLFSDLGVNLVRLNHVPYEGATAQDYWGSNDNGDPFAIDWRNFNFCTRPDRCNDDWKVLLAELRGFGVNGEYFGHIQGPRWNGFDGGSEFDEDELVENQLALFLHYRDRLGLSVRSIAPFSEPGGGGINWRISPSQAASVVAKLGRRLEAVGIDVQMIVPDAVGVGQSGEYAHAILSNSRARRYVAAIGYHAYDTKDGGASPDPGWVNSRARLRDVATSHRVPLRMTEYCCLAGLLPRANHIFNELEHADSQTYFPQFIIRKTGLDGHGGRVTETARETIAFYTTGPDGRLVRFGPTRYTGVAIGHYSRYARPGSVRLAVSSTDPGVRVQAFRAGTGAEMAVVAINNHPAPRRIAVTVTDGPRVTGLARGEQTLESGGGYWGPISDVRVVDSTTAIFQAPGRSVTSLSVEVAP